MYRSLLVSGLLSGLALAAAAPAFAEATVYSCRIERRIEGQDVQVYSQSLRSDPALRFRFAIDIGAGKACRLDGGQCMPIFSTLNVAAEGDNVKATGTRLTDGVPTTLTLLPNGGMTFAVAGSGEGGKRINSQTVAGANDCVATAEKVMLR
jgi:hypothetical protein